MSTTSTEARSRVSTEHIEITAGVCGGKPRIAGHRIRVQDIYVWHELQGQTPEEIVADFPQLTLGDVHAAIIRVSTGTAVAVPEVAKPAIAPKKSITNDYIICLEDGRRIGVTIADDAGTIHQRPPCTTGCSCC